MNSIFLHKKIKISPKGPRPRREAGEISPLRGGGKKNVDAFLIKLQTKNLILLVGKNGYIMCGYLNLKAANKFKDIAIKVTGVSTIKDVIKAKVHSLSNAAKKLGIRKGQEIKEVIQIIA